VYPLLADFARSGISHIAEMNTSANVDVVGVGLNATDTIIVVPALPSCGAKVESSSVKILPGGQVATAMIACQRWGLRTRYVGKLGDDSAAEIHRQEFNRTGVETHLITVPACSSQQSFILVDPEGERTAIGWREERLALQSGELDREWIVNARALLVDGYDTAAASTAAAWAREAGIPVIADLDEAYPGIGDLLPNIDYLVVSRDFPRRLCGEARLEESLPLLQRQFESRLTAATLGSEGVLAWDGKQFHYAAAYRVSVADTTGAGDIFHAGFIYGLLRDWSLQRKLNFACAAAALNCTAIGARGGICAVTEIESLMAKRERYPAAFDLSRISNLAEREHE
jgi:sulfofructose kinase